ncbi:MAG: RDD family protein [Cyanothece sp. SIO1E1]|nr:RDD family protein [Cyanothece sp. SIO1E1]
MPAYDSRYDSDLVPQRLPKVPLWRRGSALLIDFLVASALSALIGFSPAARAVIFLMAWLGLRVLIVSKNQGQSLGRWALDMKVIHAKLGGTPLLTELAKREGVLGFNCLLMLMGLVNLSPTAAWALILPLPLAIDCGLALIDLEYNQAFHDRLAQTLVVQSRRGYSLDLRLKKLFVQVQRRMR